LTPIHSHLGKVPYSQAMLQWQAHLATASPSVLLGGCSARSGLGLDDVQVDVARIFLADMLEITFHFKHTHSNKISSRQDASALAEPFLSFLPLTDLFTPMQDLLKPSHTTILALPHR